MERVEGGRNSKVHNVLKSESCQTSHSHCIKWLELRTLSCWTKRIHTYSKTSTRDDDQAGREQRSVHNGNVDLHGRDRPSFQLAGTVSGQAAFDKPVRLAAMCVREGPEDKDLVGVEAEPDWRGRARPRNRPTQKEREVHEATRVPFRDLCTHCVMAREGAHITTSLNKRAGIGRENLPMQ